MTRLEDCMTTVKPRRMPKNIASEGVNMMLAQIRRHTSSQEEVWQLIKLMGMEYPGKPMWWLIARVLWEKERGICG